MRGLRRLRRLQGLRRLRAQWRLRPTGAFHSLLWFHPLPHLRPILKRRSVGRTGPGRCVPARRRVRSARRVLSRRSRRWLISGVHLVCGLSGGFALDHLDAARPPNRVDPAGGLHRVMRGAQVVEVLDLGASSLRGEAVIELLDVVGLAGPGDGSHAPGHGALGSAQAQVLSHGGRRPVALGRQREERPGGRVGEDALPAVDPGGETTGHHGGDRGDALDRAGRIGVPEQRQDGDDHVEPIPLGRDLDTAGLEHAAGEDRVTQVLGEHGATALGDAPVVEGHGQALGQGCPLGGAQGTGGVVEAAREREDLRNRAGDDERCRAVRASEGLDPALFLGREGGLLLLGAEPGDRARQLPAEPFGRDAHVPGRHALVQPAARLGTESLGLAEQAREPLGGHRPALEQGEHAREQLHSAVGVLHQAMSAAARGPQGTGDLELDDVGGVVRLRVSHGLRPQRRECAMPGGRLAGFPRGIVPEMLERGGEERRVLRRGAFRQALARQRDPGADTGRRTRARGRTRAHRRTLARVLGRSV